MKRSPFLILALLAGCASPVTNETAPSHPKDWEEIHISYSHRLQHWRRGESATIDQPPDGAYRATVRVTDVDVPFPPPAESGEYATVTFSVTPGMLPCFPKCRRILMRYEPLA